MKNLIVVLAIAFFSMSINAQEQKPQEKAKKECASKDSKCSSKDHKTCSADEKKSCEKEKKAGCCAKKA